MSALQFRIMHISGPKNIEADCLSRNKVAEECSEYHQPVCEQELSEKLFTTYTPGSRAMIKRQRLVLYNHPVPTLLQAQQADEAIQKLDEIGRPREEPLCNSSTGFL